MGYTRKCPRCEGTLTYSTRSNMKYNKNKNTLCRQCKHHPNAPYEKNKKWCNKCQTNKSFNSFGKNKSTNDGLSCYCKKCCNTLSKQNWKDNKKELSKQKKKYYKNNKKQIQSQHKEYYENNKKYLYKKQKEWNQNNPEKRRASNARWERNNPEKSRTSKRKWDKNNPKIRLAHGRKRRAKKAEVNENYTTEQEKITREAFNHKCFNCGSTNKLHIDHHRPLSKGNPLTLSNAVLLCQICNSSKHNKDPEDFYGEKKCAKLDKILIKIALNN